MRVVSCRSVSQAHVTYRRIFVSQVNVHAQYVCKCFAQAFGNAVPVCQIGYRPQEEGIGDAHDNPYQSCLECGSPVSDQNFQCQIAQTNVVNVKVDQVKSSETLRSFCFGVALKLTGRQLFTCFMNKRFENGPKNTFQFFKNLLWYLNEWKQASSAKWL